MKSPKFEKILALDCETTGFNNTTHDPSVYYQMVSVGMLVANTSDFKPIDKLYCEIKWDGKSIWSEEAQRIHGFSKQYLEQNGLEPEKAAEKIGLFLFKHFGTDKAISCLGQNVANFDVPFLRGFLRNYELPFKFAHRHVDTFSLSMPLLGTYSSDELFSTMGFSDRVKHNSLEDAEMALKSCQIIKKMWNKLYEKR